MRIRWSEEAARDLERIYERIHHENPRAARQVVRTLYDGCAALKRFPTRGRLGREPGTRELVFTPLPYVVVYRVNGEAVEISRVWHGAQDWP